METWLIWNLTGGPNGGMHVTDVTNASRTMLMDIDTLHWDDELLAVLRRAARRCCRRSAPSAEVYGTAPTRAARACGSRAALGDQQAALFGQTCFTPGRGEVHVRHRQLPAAQHRHRARPVHARAAHHGRLPDRRRARGVRAGGLDRDHRLAGAVVPRQPRADHTARRRSRRWRRTVEDNGGCYIVPAFSGLFAPHWRSEARGVIVGLTSYITKGHLARAVLEATGWQTREVVDAMNADSGLALTDAARSTAG